MFGVRKDKSTKEQNSMACSLFVAEGDILSDPRCNIVCLPYFDDSTRDEPIFRALKMSPEIAKAHNAYRKERSGSLAGTILPVCMTDRKMFLVLYLKRAAKTHEIDLAALNQCLAREKKVLKQYGLDLVVGFPGYADFGRPYNWYDVKRTLEDFSAEVQQTIWIIRKEMPRIKRVQITRPAFKIEKRSHFVIR